MGGGSVARVSSRMAALCLAFSGLAASAGSAWAQASEAPRPVPARGTMPGPGPGSAPSNTSGASTLPADVKAVLTKAREAMAKVQGLRYTAESEAGAMGMGEKSKATVTLARGEADVWKILVEGTTASQGGTQAGERKLHVAYDGATARSVVESEKAVVEQSSNALREVMRFFSQQRAGRVVAWEALRATPFETFDNATAGKVLAQEEIGGVRCDVLELTMPAGEPPEGVPGTVRVAFGADDGLLRRIERSSSGGGMEVKQTLTLTQVTPGAAAGAATFVINPPEGYTVRPAGPRRAAAPTPATPGAPGAPGADRPAAPGGDAPAARPAHDPRLLALNSVAPDFSLKDSEGKTWTMADFKGKVVLVDFWGSWCPPCRAAMPSVQKLHEEFKDQGVIVIGMNFEQNKSVDPAKWKKEKGYTYPSLLEAQTIARAWKVNGWPTFYVLDREGRVVWGTAGFGGAQGFENAAREAIRKALAQQG